MNNIFKGLITACITPFKDENIDFTALAKILEYQINNKIEAVVIAGSSGEGLSLTLYEYEELLKAAINIANNRIAIIGACSASSTKYAVNMARIANQLGADGLMVSLPPYIKPTQEGIYEHFKAIHDESSLSIMLYSVFGRIGVEISDNTIIELAKLPRVLALKDSCANLERPLRILDKVENFNILGGDDSLALAFNAQGALGCVSVASNIAPALCREVQELWDKGDFSNALKLQQRLLPLYQALFLEPNPIGAKCGAAYLGLCEDELRLPLIKCNTETQTKIQQAIKLLNVRA